MRLPRLIIGSAGYIRLWQSQRRETARLRRELAAMTSERDEWRDKLLVKVNVTPLFTPPPKPIEPVTPPPIGPMSKKLMLASQRGPVNAPTVEELARNGN